MYICIYTLLQVICYVASKAALVRVFFAIALCTFSCTLFTESGFTLLLLPVVESSINVTHNRVFSFVAVYGFCIIIVINLGLNHLRSRVKLM